MWTKKVLGQLISILFGVRLDQFIESNRVATALRWLWAPTPLTNGGNDRTFTVTNSLAFLGIK